MIHTIIKDKVREAYLEDISYQDSIDFERISLQGIMESVDAVEKLIEKQEQFDGKFTHITDATEEKKGQEKTLTEIERFNYERKLGQLERIVGDMPGRDDKLDRRTMARINRKTSLNEEINTYIKQKSETKDKIKFWEKTIKDIWARKKPAERTWYVAINRLVRNMGLEPLRRKVYIFSGEDIRLFKDTVDGLYNSIEGTPKSASTEVSGYIKRIKENTDFLLSVSESKGSALEHDNAVANFISHMVYFSTLHEGSLRFLVNDWKAKEYISELKKLSRQNLEEQGIYKKGDLGLVYSRIFNKESVQRLVKAAQSVVNYHS